MTTFFPKEVWKLIVDYLPIWHDIYRRRLKRVTNEVLVNWENEFHLYALEFPRSVHIKYKRAHWEEMADDSIGLSMAMLPGPVYVPLQHVADNLNDPRAVGPSMGDTYDWLYDSNTLITYCMVTSYILELPYYRRAMGEAELVARPTVREFNNWLEEEFG